MEALADALTVTADDGPNEWVRADVAAPLLRELDCSRQVAAICFSYE
jgi:hypothetical protein